MVAPNPVLFRLVNFLRLPSPHGFRCCLPSDPRFAPLPSTLITGQAKRGGVFGPEGEGGNDLPQRFFPASGGQAAERRHVFRSENPHYSIGQCACILFSHHDLEKALCVCVSARRPHETNEERNAKKSHPVVLNSEGK